MSFPLSHRRRAAMGIGESMQYQESIDIAAPSTAVYALITDIGRTGEWSPVCVSCSWEDGGGPRVGAWFTGRNEADGHTWTTRSQVVVADPDREFAWQVGEGYVRWGYRLEQLDERHTRLVETWHFLPAGMAMFRQKYSADADARIELRAGQARAGIPASLKAIKQLAEHSGQG